MNNKIIFGIGGIVLGILFVWIFTPMMWYGSYGMMGWRKGSVSEQRVNRDFQTTTFIDNHFIEQMIPHHEGAIEMAKLALVKSQKVEVKQLAKLIIKAQESENQQMKSWYNNWFGKDVPQNVSVMGGMMSRGGMHMGSLEDITNLKNARDFDKVFIEQMIPHHQLAIMMAQMLRSGTSRPEMQVLAENIISSQSKEILQMQEWYTTWYR